MKFQTASIALTLSTSAVLLVTATIGLTDSAMSIERAGTSNKRPTLAPAQPPQRPVPGAGPQLGDALPGLSAQELAVFTEGRDEFEAEETPEGGLGPVFNNVSCVSCHSAGATGGASDEKVTRFGRFVDGKFDALEHLGGSLLHAMAIDPAVQETLPTEANVVAQRLATPVFGAGLIEAIPDQDIKANAARNKPDGVKGRANEVLDVASGRMRVGRFGWKAQQATLLSFAGDAYLNEMGVTSRLFPTENAPNGRLDLLVLYDKVPELEDTVDPVTGKGDIDHAADFMRLLAPPPHLRATAASLEGEKLFEKTGCTSWHLPSMMTGASPVRMHSAGNRFACTRTCCCMTWGRWATASSSPARSEPKCGQRRFGAARAGR